MERKSIEELIEENSYLVEFVLLNYFYDVKDDDDLKQIGLIALWEATKSYKAVQHATFQTYLRRCIKNSITDELRKRRASRQTLNDLTYTVSLSQPISEEHDFTVEDEIADRGRADFSSRDVHEFLDTLNEVERQVVYNSARGYSVPQIAERVHLSKYLTRKCLDDVKTRLKKQCL